MATSTSMKRIAAYQRVSTASQSGERHVSLETQASRIAAYGAAQGYPVVATFTDVASGRKDARVEYQRMLAFVRDGHADAIVVQFLDRFGRNPREILSRIWALQEAGVEVECTDETVKEELVLLVRAGLAGAESKRTSERVRATMRDAIRKGRKPGVPPFGYRKSVDGFEIEPSEAEQVRRMVDLAVHDNLGFKAIADRMNAEGYRTRKGRAWSSTTAYQTLTSPALAGVLVYGARSKHADTEILRIDDYYTPPVLDASSWAALSERLAVRQESPKGRAHASDYLLSGTAKCGYCHGPLVGHMQNVKGRRYKRYVCSNHIKTNEYCSHANGHMAEALEAAVLNAMGAYLDPKRVRALVGASSVKAVDANAKRLEAVERELTKLDTDLKRDLDLMGRGVLDERDFAVANEGRRDRRATLKDEQATLSQAASAAKSATDAVATLPARVGSFLELVKSAPVQQAKAELQLLLKAVHVTRDGIEIEVR